MATVSKQTTSTTHPPVPALEPSLAETWKAFQEAFNRQDVKAVASFWESDGTLVSPVGQWGIGRSGVETVYAYDVEHFLRGTTSRFEVERIRHLGRDLACLDLSHSISGARMPDGTTGTMRLHLVLIARNTGSGWRWLDARPYAFLPEPPGGAMH